MQVPDFPEVDTESHLKAELARYLNHLLDHDLQRLLQGLYRIDVDENAVKQILETGNPDQMASKLADLIIERQKQKLYFRQKYRNQ